MFLLRPSLLLRIFAYILCFSAQATAGQCNPLLLAVQINQQDLNQVVEFLQTETDTLWVSESDLKKWRVKIPAQKPLIYQHQRYYNLSNLAKLTYSINYKHLSVDLHIPAPLFEAQAINVNQQTFLIPTKPKTGVFLNYDTLAQTGSGDSRINGILTPGIFTPYGAGTSDVFFEHQHGINHAVRLNTYWQIDNPSQMTSIRVGDSFNNPGMWGKSVDFGGIKWGTNFATQPSFITYPLPTTNGTAVIPSVVDLYINNALSSSQTLPAGPFTINTIPVVTGAGSISMVTTDLLGRQQSITIPYYASSSLLKPGLEETTVELGAIRENYSVNSNDYGSLMAVGTQRIGLTERLTGEGHTEILHDQQTLGIGGNYLVANQGVINLAVAGSHNHQGLGELAMLGYQHQSLHQVNYGINVQLASPYFTQVGLQPGQPAPACLEQIFAGIPLQKNASLGMGYIQQNNRDSSNAHLINVNYNRNLVKEWSLNVSTLVDVASTHQKTLFLTLTHALDNRTTVNSGFTGEAGNNQGTLQLARALPAGSGLGYSVYTAQGEEQNYQASVSAQNDAGTFTAAAAQQHDETGYQLQAQGGIANLDGETYFTRSLGDSFAVVQVPGYDHVGIYANNQIVAHTNAKGSALIPHLLPYQNNPIRIEPNDLPIDAQVKATQINAVPYANSGLMLKFPIQKAYTGRAIIHDENQQPLPAGAIIKPVTGEGQSIIADEGEVYLTNLLLGLNHFQAQWDDHLCYFDITYNQTTAPLPQLGTFICQENPDEDQN